MAKRLTDSEKWKDPWFCSLGVNEKLFWMYLCDNCDHAGIWMINWPLVEFHFKLKKEDIDLTVYDDRIIAISDEKWYIPKFVKFQYGDLNPQNKAHKSVLNILSSLGAIKGLVRGMQGPKDKDKDKDTRKGVQGETKKDHVFVRPKLLEVLDFFAAHGYSASAAEKAFAYYEAAGWVDSNGKKVRNWKQKMIAVWFKPENLAGPRTSDPSVQNFEDLKRKNPELYGDNTSPGEESI
jgi:hypothetical protein